MRVACYNDGVASLQARFSVDTLQSRLRNHISVFPSNAGNQTAAWMSTFGANQADVADMQRQYHASVRVGRTLFFSKFPYISG
jgi:hypothetical protein